MVTAFVLLGAEQGSEFDLVRELKPMSNVESAYAVYGTFDVVVNVVAETIEKVKETITWKIRRLEKTRSTVTLIVLDEAT